MLFSAHINADSSISMASSTVSIASSSESTDCYLSDDSNDNADENCEDVCEDICEDVDSIDDSDDNVTIKTINFSFFSEPISIRYQEALLQDLPNYFNDNSISSFTLPSYVEKFQPTVEDLYIYQKELNLNDWLFYQLVQKCGEEIYNKPNQDINRLLFSWLVLGNLNYIVQLNLNQENIYLSVFTLDQIYSVPTKKYGVGWLAEISGKMPEENKGFIATYRADQYLNGTKPFSFKFDRLPYLTNNTKTHKKLRFLHQNKIYTVEYHINESLIQMLEGYPEMHMKNYLNFPLSVTAYNSLIPELNQHMIAMTEEESIRFLLSFIRQAFQYGDDAVHYKQDNLTFCPEQTLSFDYSDCEDRSILFAYLVEELFNKEVIIINYDNHVAVGILLDKFIGKPVFHNSQYYTFCDPTGPSDKLEIGEYPPDLIGATYSVID